MNSLIIGASGTIGSALLQYHQANELPAWGSTHKEVTLQTNSYFHLNLLDPSTTWRFPDVDFKVAYLSAGICKMALCEADPSNTRKVNIDGMSALVHQLADAGAFVVFLSTNQVFSGNQPHELATAAHDPLNEYGRQKAELETLIMKYCKKWAIVRLTKVVEPNMSIIKNWIDCLLLAHPIKAFYDMMLAPVSLRQVVKTITLIGQKQQTGIYQISGQEDVSYYDLATYLAQCLECPTSLVEGASAVDQGIKKIFLPRFTSLDCSSTISLCDQTLPHYSNVVRECFEIPDYRHNLYKIPSTNEHVI